MRRMAEQARHLLLQEVQVRARLWLGRHDIPPSTRGWAIDAVVGEKHGPVVYAIVSHEAPDGKPRVRMCFSQRQRGRETGTDKGAVHVDATATLLFRRKIVAEP